MRLASRFGRYNSIRRERLRITVKEIGE
ncbi:Putative uncharacterized protein [Escherichia coli D6-117.29]|nr:Putative uncharacterized protein [Escherichia coli D6-117.29]